MRSLRSGSLLTICTVFAIAAVLLTVYFIKPYKIHSSTMEDTIVSGDFVLVNKSAYLIRDPHRGDVIVCADPADPVKDFVMRVIGVPGDEVGGINKEVFVNGGIDINPHVVHKEKDVIPREYNPRDNFGPVKVPEGYYFVMGDNRDRSYDSRFWGFVKNSKIKGPAIIKYWSWDSTTSRVRWGSIGRPIN